MSRRTAAHGVARPVERMQAAARKLRMGGGARLRVPGARVRQWAGCGKRGLHEGANPERAKRPEQGRGMARLRRDSGAVAMEVGSRYGACCNAPAERGAPHDGRRALGAMLATRGEVGWRAGAGEACACARVEAPAAQILGAVAALRVCRDGFGNGDAMPTEGSGGPPRAGPRGDTATTDGDARGRLPAAAHRSVARRWCGTSRCKEGPAVVPTASGLWGAMPDTGGAAAKGNRQDGRET